MSLEKTDKEAVVSHYSVKDEVSLSERHKKPNHSFSALSNWIKANLIQKHVPYRAVSVLDLGCGKGSDAHKFAYAGIRSYVGIDLCEASITAGQKRLNHNAGSIKSRIQSSLLVGDFSELEKQRLGKFSLVSAFFSLQYSFQSAETVSGLLKAISNHLVSGGFFLGTIPDGSKIYEELKQDRHCNSFKIEWGQTPIESGFGTNGLGLRYLFSLHSSFNQIPEHALPFSIFSSLAKQVGFKVLTSTNFKEVYESAKPNSSHHKLLLQMNKGQDLPLTSEELELAGLYRTFVFQKI